MVVDLSASRIPNFEKFGGKFIWQPERLHFDPHITGEDDVRGMESV